MIRSSDLRKLAVRLPGAAGARRARQMIAKPTLRAARTSEHLDSLTVEMLIATVSEANRRDHWRTAAARHKRQREHAYAALMGLLLPALPVRVRMVRIGKHRLDSDNCAGALKHVQDGIADAYGVDDGGDRIEWGLGQEIGEPVMVRVEITRKAEV